MSEFKNRIAYGWLWPEIVYNHGPRAYTQLGAARGRAWSQSEVVRSCRQRLLDVMYGRGQRLWAAGRGWSVCTIANRGHVQLWPEVAR